MIEERFKASTQWLLDVASHFSSDEGMALFYSGGMGDAAEKSWLFLFPYEKLEMSPSRQAWEALDAVTGEDACASGFISYEMGAFADLKRQLPAHPTNEPGILFHKHGTCLCLDHNTEVVQAKIDPSRTPEQYHSFKEFKGTVREKHTPQLHLKSVSETKQSFIEKVGRAQELIQAGDIYQVNLSLEIVLEGHFDPFSLFEAVTSLNPAPFSAFIKTKNGAMISSSPERFLKKEKSRLQTRPIKGTAPRGATLQEDELRKQTLLDSEKERAELLMITDLMRSDLSRIAAVGSVETKEIWRLEAYTNVFHLVSVIEAAAKPEYSMVAMVRALFPGGSVTGCPKMRAMEVIHDLEKAPRGLYTGSMGYFSGGDFDFNIAIRTLVTADNQIRLRLGSGVVLDSDPEREFEETLHKGQSLFKVLGLWESSF